MSLSKNAVKRLDAIQDHLKTEGGQYDVAVVGLGALGSAAAYHAAKKGARVIGFEQFEFGHVRGASHDTSRIVRTSYELPQYIALAQAAYKGWAELERESQQKLLTITGGVIIFEKDGIPNATSWAKGLDANGVPYEKLTAQEANARWSFNIKESQEVIYTADSGIAHASKSVAAMQFLARANGAELKEHTKVESVISHGQSVSIETSKGHFSAKKIILACDAWVNELLPTGMEIPLTVTQEQVTYFASSKPENFEPDRLPVWVLTGKQWYYGFPNFGEPAIKCGHDNTGIITTAEKRSFLPDARIEEDLSSAIQNLIPDPTRKKMRTVTCLYALTSDRQFIIASVPKHEDILVLMGGGHAFKFAPVFGRIGAELALDGKTKEDISLFGFPTKEKLADSGRLRIAG